MSYSYRLKSHQHQTLNTHLEEVTRIALESHNSHGGDSSLIPIISSICMCHDFGKGTSYFLDYLNGQFNGIEKNHGQISAFFAYWVLPKQWKHLGFLVVKKHHGDLENANREVKYDESWDFHKQIEDIRENWTNELNHIYSSVIGENSIEDFLKWLEDIQNQKSVMRTIRKKKFTTEEFIISQYIYSILLSADKSQLITGQTFIPFRSFSSECVKNYKNNIITKALKKNPKLQESIIFKLRNDIYSDLMRKLENIDFDRNKIFSIHVPTGSGKTILAYQAAFYIAEYIHNSNSEIFPMIVYALPFTSIIDQNYNVLIDMIKESLNRDPNDEEVLKFHSLTPIEYDNLNGYDARFCFENWQSKIITTTFVQFFNTIFKVGKNSITNRFHRLSNSVIILDEVQVINNKYYLLIRDLITYLSKKFNIYIILVTATMPMLLETEDLIENKIEYFKKLKRIEIQNYSGFLTTLGDFERIVEEDIKKNKNKSFLIVMNTVKSSKEVYEYLSDLFDNVIYLSTEIYPKLRLERIQKIRESDEKSIIVSTQLIEAGVDIDIDIIYRDFAPLDSINQTAGRANRNGVGGKGVVKIYNIVDSRNIRYCNYIYPRFLLNATESILKDKEIVYEKDMYELNEDYFKKVKNLLSNDTSKEMLGLIEKLQYKDFRDMFELIDKEELIKEDIIINADEVSNGIIMELQNNIEFEPVELKNKFRKLNEYRISIPKKELDDINTKEIEKFEISYVEMDNYDDSIGVKRRKSLII